MKKIQMPKGTTPPRKFGDGKFCVDCKFCIEHNPPLPFLPSLRCHHQNAGRDGVTGAYNQCGAVRIHHCSGGWFEPKPPPTGDELSAYFKITPSKPDEHHPWSPAALGWPQLGGKFWWWILILASITIGLIIVTQF